MTVLHTNSIYRAMLNRQNNFFNLWGEFTDCRTQQTRKTGEWGFKQFNISWSELLKNDQYNAAFLLQSVYESLKLSDYQQYWRLTIGPLLKLCGKWTLKRTVTIRIKTPQVFRDIANVMKMEGTRKRISNTKTGVIYNIKKGNLNTGIIVVLHLKSLRTNRLF